MIKGIIDLVKGIVKGLFSLVVLLCKKVGIGISKVNEIYKLNDKKHKDFKAFEKRAKEHSKRLSEGIY